MFYGMVDNVIGGWDVFDFDLGDNILRILILKENYVSMKLRDYNKLRIEILYI